MSNISNTAEYGPVSIAWASVIGNKLRVVIRLNNLGAFYQADWKELRPGDNELKWDFKYNHAHIWGTVRANFETNQLIVINLGYATPYARVRDGRHNGDVIHKW